MAYVLYIATLLGGVGLLMMMPKRAFNWTALGGLIGAGALGLAWLVIAARFRDQLGDPNQNALAGAAFNFYYVFSAIAIGAAVRVITHTRPVYAALWFVLVVLASAGLFLTLSAEFMAFAMILIYAGAILVTYMFVIMLATQARSAEVVDEELPDYERIAREPLAAVAAGFILLAVLLHVAFDVAGLPKPAEAPALTDAYAAEAFLADRPSVDVFTDDDAPATLTNSERLGLDLFRGNPLGLELAGVVLLVSLVGAVIIARKHVEDEDAVIAQADA